MSVAVIDSGGANLGSVLQSLGRLGVEATLTQEAEVIKTADRVILPGVGTAKAAMATLVSKNLVSVIQQLTQPVLGICLGLQLLYESSEEGEGITPCLGVIEGRIKRLEESPKIRLPHMGWNQLQWIKDDPIRQEGSDEDWFYFVHSFGIDGQHPSVVATSDHGGLFGAVIRRNNFLACQFHPEKSAGAGQRLIERFLAS